MKESLFPGFNWLSPFRGILNQVTSVYLRNQSNKLLNKIPVTCTNKHALGANMLTQKNLTSSLYSAKAGRRGTQLSNIFSTNQIHADDSKQAKKNSHPCLVGRDWLEPVKLLNTIWLPEKEQKKK